MVEILPAVQGDLPVIFTLANEIWGEAYKNILSPEQIKYMLREMYSMPVLEQLFHSLDHHFILAWQDQVAVGFALYHPKENLESVTRLSKIYIHPSLQRKGIGKQMMRYIEKVMVSSNMRILELNVNRHNPAIEFYKRLGFEIIEEEDIDIGEGYYMNDYIMQKNIV